MASAPLVPPVQTSEAPVPTAVGDAQRKPSFFGEYDTSMFLVSWWYRGCTAADQRKRRCLGLLGGRWSGNGPGLGPGSPGSEPGWAIGWVPRAAQGGLPLDLPWQRGRGPDVQQHQRTAVRTAGPRRLVSASRLAYSGSEPRPATSCRARAADRRRGGSRGVRPLLVLRSPLARSCRAWHPAEQPRAAREPGSGTRKRVP